MSIHQQSTFRNQLSKVGSHIQHELLYLSWGLMEVALITPLSFSILRWARYWPPDQIALWLLLLMFLPFNLTRLMSLLDIPLKRQQTGMVAALLLTILISIRTLIYGPESLLDMTWLAEFFINLAAPGNNLWLRDIAIFIIVIIMWWRGLRLATRNFEIEGAGFRLRLGILVIPLAVWFSQIGLGWNITPFVLLFFLAGLTALSLIRAEEIEQTKTGFSSSLSPRWLTLIFSASLLTVTISGLLAAIISGESLFTVAGWLSPLLMALYLGGNIILNTVLYLLRPLISLVAFLIDRLALWLVTVFSNSWVDPQVTELDFGGLLPTETATDVVEIIAPPNFNARILTILLMVTAVLLISLSLVRLYKQAAFAVRNSETIDNKTLQYGEEMGLGKRLLRRLGLWRRWRAAASVRRIYRQMLKAAEGSGYPRGESETPYEFLATLAEIWPENTTDSHLITQAFVKVRYGELPETDEELAELETAWKRLRNSEPENNIQVDPN